MRSDDASTEPAAEDVFTSWSLRLRSSDRRAFAEVFQATHTALLRYAWRFTGEEAARDIVQEAYLKLWQVRETLDPSRSLKALLYTMVRNLALNHNRSLQQHATSVASLDGWEASQDTDLEKDLDASFLSRRIHAWIAEMPERRREAFLLSRFHGLSHEEIAHIMDLTPRTVNTHIVLALKYLRHRLGELEPDPTAP